MPKIEEVIEKKTLSSVSEAQLVCSGGNFTYDAVSMMAAVHHMFHDGAKCAMAQKCITYHIQPVDIEFANEQAPDRARFCGTATITTKSGSFGHLIYSPVDPHYQQCESDEE